MFDSQSASSVAVRPPLLRTRYPSDDSSRARLPRIVASSSAMRMTALLTGVLDLGLVGKRLRLGRVGLALLVPGP